MSFLQARKYFFPSLFPQTPHFISPYPRTLMPCLLGNVDTESGDCVMGRTLNYNGYMLVIIQFTLLPNARKPKARVEGRKL